jgi:hypothetical protein
VRRCASTSTLHWIPLQYHTTRKSRIREPMQAEMVSMPTRRQVAAPTRLFFIIGAPTRLGISSLAQRGVQILQFDDGGVICEDMWS